jgi:hypothetical protein
VKLSPWVAVLTVSLAPKAWSAQQPEPEDWAPRKGRSHVLGFGYQGPDGPVVSAGLIVGTVPAKQNECAFGATSSGLLLQGHVALNGPKLSIGVASYNPGVGYAAKLSMLHLWRAAGDSPSGGTLIGPEVEGSLYLVRLSVGVLWQVGGPSGQSPRFTWGGGVGF